jgi:chaperonin cofactor prefoldin
MPVKTGTRPSLAELERAVELLQGKLHTLKLAQGRIEREAQRLSEEIRALLSVSKPSC